MKMIIVGMDDGIILDANKCVILDESTLDVHERTLLDSGTDTEAMRIAERHGVALRNILQGCGYGELHYGNCLAVTPSVLHQEFVEVPALIPEGSDEVAGVQTLKELFAWGASLSYEDLKNLCNDIIMDDELWGAWQNSVFSHLEYRYNEHMEKKS